LLSIAQQHLNINKKATTTRICSIGFQGHNFVPGAGWLQKVNLFAGGSIAYAAGITHKIERVVCRLPPEKVSRWPSIFFFIPHLTLYPHSTEITFFQRKSIQRTYFELSHPLLYHRQLVFSYCELSAQFMAFN